MSKLKECNKCGGLKKLDEFFKQKKHKDGLSYACKKCEEDFHKLYRKTKEGIYTTTYGGQRGRSRKRGHLLPNYTKEELITWMILNGFDELFEAWVNSNYDTNLKPSCDRLDDSKAYTLDNLRLVTWGEHKNKTYKDIREGRLITDRPHKITIGVCKKTGDIIKFHSLMEASRQLGISNSHISENCLGKRKSAGGYIWSYKTQ